MASVVHFQEIEPEIVLLTMEDRVHKNTFSKELIDGLLEAFAVIEASNVYKVVVLTGYDSYFASGGTREGLLAIHEGREKFTDKNVYSLALDCKIPVIAAMQGHGIGGGFIMGLFADFVILSRESVYTTNFMKYGFTPGMGATCILPRKLGISLTEELLINSGTYRGAELEKRGIPFPVLPRAEVLGHALELARQIAEKPRYSLILLKDHLVAPIREELPSIVEREVMMHEKTFHQPEVRERINALFGK
ncbi:MULTISPECIES: polyketide synthase [unclassified Thermoactinomyces]|jgi:polyketide biosynthesis enoyl-CoA hydratase PksI|uniref:polyketide synthase n=1 Tax=unclassified Thermoactinomyces TaxID=2634588 RepID=UPI0018DD2005|nr:MULTISPECIES: polyketide synthase [unclassified Thermoactinomyces]MBH8599156.1 enoyl-CoA hydratase/isomerase family protein [Thermoactinomyces sp. CICC 10523]MBH8605627.1 enoyl-CoA hydratase/isomerase family protein [Thermoactinomyces sp. CICC 10522]MBH8609164.1 enoyl-CoA hydratase/isomerase family protein [Thermoactinomyces sp. CICC 10521]